MAVIPAKPGEIQYEIQGLEPGRTYSLYGGPTCIPMGTVTVPDIPTPSKADSEFKEFLRNNPEVYTELVRLARQARAAGRKKIGIRMLWERMRWTFMVDTVRNSEFKLNNNYTSRYARLIMETESDLQGFFDLRQIKF